MGVVLAAEPGVETEKDRLQYLTAEGRIRWAVDTGQ